MLSYFTRRLAGGVFALLVATFIFHSLIAYATTGIMARCMLHKSSFHPPRSDVLLCQRIERQYELDKPWAMSYLLWMFDPVDTLRLDLNNYLVRKGIDFTVLDFHVQGSGLLTGDFGESHWVAARIPALQVYGIHLPTLLALTLVPSLALMLLATLQRRGRHPLRNLSFAQARELHGIRSLHALG